MDNKNDTSYEEAAADSQGDLAHWLYNEIDLATRQMEIAEQQDDEVNDLTAYIRRKTLRDVLHFILPPDDGDGIPF